MLETQRPGFTMVEAIMVAALIGLVATIGGPRVSAALQRRAAGSAADQFVLAHSLTRSTAIRYGRIARLHIDVPGQTVWLDVDTSANGSGQRATISNVRYINDGGLTMASNRTLLCFDARGLASTMGSCPSGDAQVIFSDGAMADTVTTTVLGKVLR